MSRRRRILFGLVTAVLGIVFCLLLAEVVVRFVAPQPLAGVMFSEDPAFGFWLRSGLRAKSFQSEPGSPAYRVTTERHGYRGMGDVVLEKAAGTVRVLALGDSFTFGVGVDDGDCWPAQLEKRLNAGGGDRHEVVNAACPGWGTENQLAFWRVRGRALAPDVVVVAFYRNDLWDNLRQLIFTVRGGDIVYSPKNPFGLAKRITRIVPFYAFLSEHSHLVNLLRRLVVMASVGDKAVSEGWRAHMDATAPAAEASRLEAWAAGTTGTLPVNVNRDLMAAQRASYVPLLETLAREIRDSGAQVVLAILPGEDDCVSTPIAYYEMVEQLAAGWEAQGLLDAVNLRGPLLDARRAGKRLYLPVDGHFTPEANGIVADELSREVLGLSKR